MQPGKLTMKQWSCSNIFRVNATGYQAFVLEATGLKPDTIHEFFMDTELWDNVVLMTPQLYARAQVPGIFNPPQKGNNEVLTISAVHKVNEVARFLSISMKSIGSAASTLKTDRFGKMSFLVFFPLNIASWFSHDYNAASYRLDYKGYDMFYGGYGHVELAKPTYGSSGYTSLVLQDKSGTSVANRIFANRTPNKAIPVDNRGNI